ncbi:uncharacterized protein LOC116779062 [Danaus plexippus]|uniref:uncharacterized protein LOC116779062 n=1 Tax=Danaus plexippus TaxID=13037 RepID=UPI002AB0BFC4|nr:uncharacterized protein LOC116779062 [Danaus plexippus]
MNFLLSVVFGFLTLATCNCLETEETAVEARGKGKYALLIHFFYVAATKLIVLKIIYGFIFYALAVKAWHFMLWFVHYIKKRKSLDHFIEFEHEPSDGHGHYGHEYGNYDHSPYGFNKPEYGEIDYSYKKKIYDADGSYSVGGL